jgi:hypothetical protein
MSKWQNLQKFKNNTESMRGFDFPKETFQRMGRAALKELASLLEGSGYVSNCKIDYNKAGPACTGDFHLRGDFNAGGSFDLFFNLDRICGSQDICYRLTDNQKDYTGKRNNHISIDQPAHKIATAVLKLKQDHTITLPGFQETV